MSVGFAGYLGELVAIPKVPAVVGVLLALGALAAWGVRESITAAGLLTLLEIGGLALVIAFGGGALAELPERAAEIFVFDAGAWRAVGSAAVLAFYAFLGFEDMVNVAEETRDVRRTLPIAILVTIAVTAILYVLVGCVAVLTVPPAELAASNAPLALVFERSGGSAALLGVIAIFALLNGALIQIIKASRVLFSLAGQFGVPAAFGRINRRTRTPLFATAFSTAFAASLASSLPLDTLAEATSLVTLTTFALANLALLRVKRRDPRPAGVRVFPAWIPLVGFLSTCGLITLDIASRLAAS